MQQEFQPQRFPSEAHALLHAFTGRWRTSGRQMLPGNKMQEIKGTDTYEWLPGGHFLLHRVAVFVGNTRVQALEVLGVDAATGQYFMHAYDNLGNVDHMQASCNNGTWRFQGLTLRFTGAFSKEGTVLAGDWEQYLDGQWQHLMTVVLCKEE